MDDDAPSTSLDHSPYALAAADHDWLSELSEEWISNGSNASSSEAGSARGQSVRTAYGTMNSKIETIPEENETSTVRIVLGETDVQNTPEWKRRLEENRVRDLFSPCHLENLFKESTTNRYGNGWRAADSRSKSPSTSKVASQPVSPDMRHSTMKDAPITNTAAF